MLVLSRVRHESVIVSGPEGGCLVTVLQVRAGEVSLLISHSPASKPGALDSWTARLVRDETVRVGRIAEVTIVDVRDEKARIGINTSKESSVHRLEVWEAIRQVRRWSVDDDEGPGGARVPRPGGPKPPSLDVRLDEPPAEEDQGG